MVSSVSLTLDQWSKATLIQSGMVKGSFLLTARSQATWIYRNNST